MAEEGGACDTHRTKLQSGWERSPQGLRDAETAGTERPPSQSPHAGCSAGVAPAGVPLQRPAAGGWPPAEFPMLGSKSSFGRAPGSSQSAAAVLTEPCGGARMEAAAARGLNRGVSQEET